MNDPDREPLRQGVLAGSRYAISAPTMAPMGSAGALLGKGSGSSLEFMDHRQYQPGDDIRRIDWAAYGRTDHLIVRLYREEITPHVDIVLDCSRSMALDGTDKRRAALTIAAAVATAATNGGFSHALWITPDTCRPAENGTSSPLQWPDIDFNCTEDLGIVLNNPTMSWRAMSYRVLISDLLFPGDPSGIVSRLRESAAALAVIQLLAERDQNIEARGNLRLTDAETSERQEMFIDQPARERYRRRLENHIQNWSVAARQAGAMFATIIAERLCSNLQLPELVEAGVFEVE